MASRISKVSTIGTSVLLKSTAATPKDVVPIFMPRIAGAAGFHTNQQLNNVETWKIPERLTHIPTADHPSFFNMVEYYFHKACIIAEPSLEQMLHRKRMSNDKKHKLVHGILHMIEPCAHVLEMNFPLQKDDGSIEIITGYRAQHSHHKTPCKGGIRYRYNN